MPKDNNDKKDPSTSEPVKETTKETPTAEVKEPAPPTSIAKDDETEKVPA